METSDPKPEATPAPTTTPPPPPPEDSESNPYAFFGQSKILKFAMPILEDQFRIFREPSGVERLYSVNQRKEATLVLNEDLLRLALHHGLKQQFGGKIPPEHVVTNSISLWRKETTPISEDPAAFCFRGDDRLCFKRFDWIPEAGDVSAWMEFLPRLSDPEAFMAFVASCFEADNRSRQYCWLHGEAGQDGKSAVLGVLTNVFGKAAVGVSNSHVGKSANQFAYSLIYGKRVVVYADCKNRKFGMSEYVRNITSGDWVQIEFKGQTPFSAPLRCKLFVASNAEPEVGSENADLSRMIVIGVASSQIKDDPDWPKRLEAQLPAFLFLCKQAYLRLCPNGGNIKLSEGSEQRKRDIASDYEQEFASVFAKFFVLKPSAEISASTMHDTLSGWAGFKGNNLKAGEFKRWLKRTHGIECKNSNSRRRYEGLALTAEYESSRSACSSGNRPA